MKNVLKKITALFTKKKIEIRQFKIPTPFLSLQQDAAVFLFERAETFFKQVLAAEELLTERSYKLLSALVPIFLVVAGYGISLITKAPQLPNKLLLVLSIISSVCLFFAIIIIYTMLFPKNILIDGRQPLSAMQSDVFLKNKDQYRAYLLDEIKIYQMKIDANLTQYGRRLNTFKLALQLIILMLIINIMVVIGYGIIA